MRNALIRLGNSANAIPYLAALGSEVVIGIDNEKCGALPFVSNCCHVLLQGQVRHTTCVGVFFALPANYFG